jgi:hypothetical protein
VWLKCPACRGLISDEAVASFTQHFSGVPEAAVDMNADTTEQYAASPERSSSDKHSYAASPQQHSAAAATADAEYSNGYSRFDTGAIDMVISPMAAAAGSSSSTARRRKRSSTLTYEETASKVAAANSTVIDVDADATAAGDASGHYDEEQLSQDAMSTTELAATAAADGTAASSRDAHRGSYASTVSACSACSHHHFVRTYSIYCCCMQMLAELV